jgi:hypothetical protein
VSSAHSFPIKNMLTRWDCSSSTPHCTESRMIDLRLAGVYCLPFKAPSSNHLLESDHDPAASELFLQHMKIPVLEIPRIFSVLIVVFWFNNFKSHAARHINQVMLVISRRISQAVEQMQLHGLPSVIWALRQHQLPRFATRAKSNRTNIPVSISAQFVSP